jgi:hypothetical protein
MPAEIRLATTTDVPEMVGLLLRDAQNRQAHDQALWALADDADKQVEEAIGFALTAEKQPFRQQWLVAEADGRLVGIIHSALLPVPPIYAGEWGEPGLIMPECFVTEDAPHGTLAALVEAAEADLRGAGAELLVASFVCGDEPRSCLEERGYKPITLYLAKAGFERATPSGDVRLASEADIEGIVHRSAENRRILFALDAFWTPHPEADARFGSWMRKSLTLRDRDMLVAGPPDAVDGSAALADKIDGGEGLYGETDDKVVTFFSLGVIVFFVLVVVLGTIAQSALERRKEEKKAASLRQRTGW